MIRKKRPAGKKRRKEVTGVNHGRQNAIHINAKNDIDKITWKTQSIYQFESNKKDEFSSHLIPERLKQNNSDCSITALK